MANNQSISSKYFTFIESCHAWFKWWVFFLFYENGRNYIKKKHQEKPVAILANGPSLNKLDLLSVSNQDCCMVNYAPLSDLFFLVRPCYHVMVDDSFFIKSQEKLKSLLMQVSWEMTVFIPYRFWKDALGQYGGNPHLTFVPVHCTGLPDSFSFKKMAWRLFRKGKSLPIPQNVLIVAIYCMINSGYQSINIYGADHTWIQKIIVNEDNQVCKVDDHFYDGKSINEYIPLMLDSGSPSHLSHELRFQANAFAAYEMLQEYAVFEGVSIRNLTKGSFIDAFPR